MACTGLFILQTDLLGTVYERATSSQREREGKTIVRYKDAGESEWKAGVYINFRSCCYRVELLVRVKVWRGRQRIKLRVFSKGGFCSNVS